MNANNVHWHAESSSDVLAKVVSSSQGLTSTEATRRFNSYGPNELPAAKRTNWIIRFLLQFHNVLIYALLISALITLLLHHFIDTAVILGVVVLNAIFGVIQEGKAENAIAAIHKMLALTAEVIRDGKHLTVPTRELVRGDIVVIQSGDRVPADLRLIEVQNLRIQEGILTGESIELSKQVEAVAENASLGDRSCMAYSGTAVTYGKGSGVVVATGINTELGKIGALLKNMPSVVTPLIRKINQFSKWLTLAITLVALVTFLVGTLVWHNSVEQMFLAAVGLAVAAIPEGLPPVMTIILAIGVMRMARRKAIIRRLAAVETMGAVTVICTDKTGTLTRNEQTVKAVVTASVQGEINDNGQLLINQQETAWDSHSEVKAALLAALLCNDGSVSTLNGQDGTQVHGNAMDKAILNMGLNLAIDFNALANNFPRDDLIPYDSVSKLMATLHHTHHGEHFIMIKGAPEQLLLKCTTERKGSNFVPINRAYWQGNIEIWARQGYRLLAVCCKKVTDSSTVLTVDKLTQDLTMLGLLSFIDAPREEVAYAIDEAMKARIRVKMITGDHAITAATIAAQVGIISRNGVLTGEELDRMSDEELSVAVRDVDIYARTTPQHKLRLVEALQANGELVAMTGDGVNDAPALRKADIGVAMGLKGAELAKEAAEMVLADDNFATLVNAIEEGRVVYDNLKKVLMHVLPTNAAEGLVLVIAILGGVILPITAVQILWINMVTSVTLATALGFEPAESEVMKYPPRKIQSSAISKFLLIRGLLITFLLMLAVFGIFAFAHPRYGLALARTAAVNMLVLGETAYLFNCRKSYNSIFHWRYFWDNPKVFLALGATLLVQLIFTYLPFMQKFFGTVALGVMPWLIIVLVAFLIFGIIEIEKQFAKRMLLRVK